MIQRGLCLLAIATLSQLLGQQSADWARTITQQALEESLVGEHFYHLTDVFGPRPVGSPALRLSREWLIGQLEKYGVHDVHLEKNPPMEIGPGKVWDPRGWHHQRLAVHQVTPWPQTLIAAPALYSASTKGLVSGEAVFAELPPARDVETTAFITRHQGQLRGRFLMLDSKEKAIKRDFRPQYQMYSDAELTDFENTGATAPAKPKPPAKPVTTEKETRAFADTLAVQSRLFQFLKNEGVLALLRPAAGEGGTVFLRPPLAPPEVVELPPPTIDIAAEHYNRLVRQIRRGLPVRLEIELQSEFVASTGTRNVMGELPGDDKRDEIVLAGAHLDSWHGGAGATDNAAGVAVLLEAARILAKLPLRSKRTIRFAFWDGHELGTLGSRGYVAGPEINRTFCYINLDYGVGRIRGVYLQGRSELKPLFAKWLSEIGPDRLIATTRTTLGSDQATFERIGIPGISFVQDPLNYEVRSHHTNMDVPDYASVDDLRHSANVLAHLLYQLANMDEALPRR